MRDDVREYVIDAARFTTLEEFYAEISKELIPGVEWGRNLDAFNDILRGGFGTPASGFTLKWKNSSKSRRDLGYPEAVRQLARKLEHCHPTNRPAVERELERAKAGEGPTVFDWLVGIIEDHGSSGRQQFGNVLLILE